MEPTSASRPRLVPATDHRRPARRFLSAVSTALRLILRAVLVLFVVLLIPFGVKGLGAIGIPGNTVVHAVAAGIVAFVLLFRHTAGIRWGYRPRFGRAPEVLFLGLIALALLGAGTPSFNEGTGERGDRSNVRNVVSAARHEYAEAGSFTGLTLERMEALDPSVTVVDGYSDPAGRYAPVSFHVVDADTVVFATRSLADDDECVFAIEDTTTATGVFDHEYPDVEGSCAAALLHAFHQTRPPTSL